MYRGKQILPAILFIILLQKPYYKYDHRKVFGSIVFRIESLFVIVLEWVGEGLVFRVGGGRSCLLGDGDPLHFCVNILQHMALPHGNWTEINKDFVRLSSVVIISSSEF